MVLQKLCKHRKRESIGKLSPLYLLSWPDKGHSWSWASCPPGILACPRRTPGVSGCCSLCWPRPRWSRGCSRSRWPRPAFARCPSPREGHRPWCVGCDAGTVCLLLSENSLGIDLYSLIYPNLNFYYSIILSHLFRGKFRVSPSSFPFSGLRKKYYIPKHSK